MMMVLMVGEPDYGDGENCLFRHCIGGWFTADGDGVGLLVMVMVLVGW